MISILIFFKHKLKLKTKQFWTHFFLIKLFTTAVIKLQVKMIVNKVEKRKNNKNNYKIFSNKHIYVYVFMFPESILELSLEKIFSYFRK